MKSIRRSLTVWLSGGLALLWIGSGAGIFHAVRGGLIKAVDAKLTADASAVRFVLRGEGDGGSGGGRFKQRMALFQEEGSGAYYQIWDEAGATQQRSASLGDLNLSFPGSDPARSGFATIRLEDGTRLRATRVLTAPGGPGEMGKGKASKGARRRADTSVVVVAHELAETDATLSSLLGGLVVVGVLVGVGGALLVGVVLTRGLKPLRELGEQTERIDAGSLDARFEPESAPAELQPVYGRLNDLMARIQSSFERERRFSSDLAHEIRTPVAELKTLSEVALKWPDQAGESTHRETLGIACQLEEMIVSLLTLSRFETGAARVRRETIGLAPFIQDVWKPHAEPAAARRLQVRVDLAGATDWETDPSLLRHILTNLFANAIEYTPEGGSVAIVALPGEIEVANTAPGLAREDIDHVFERYWRADSARAESKHVGLGLSLAKACAGALGMSLSASLDGDWVRFSLRFGA